MTELYTEACYGLRHYSTCIMHMRTTVIVQGIILLTAASYTLKIDASIYFYLSVCFGLLLTFVLYVQQKNYLEDFRAHLSCVDKLESKIVGAEKFTGPWTNYKLKRKLREESWCGFTPIVVFGPFNFFFIVFILLGVLHFNNLLPPIGKQAEVKVATTPQILKGSEN